MLPDRSAPPKYPQHFGPFVLLARLARGGMGDVCLAKVGRVAGLERLCVVKSIRANLLGDDEYVRRFIDEARTVVQLAHRNICPVLDVGAVDAQYYLAMELIAGRDLRTIQERARQQRRALPPALVLHIVGDVLEALDYAHRLVDARTGEPLGIVHRDVSPQNVMVSFEGEVKLIDFGLATSTRKLERTEPGVVLGKLQYMSPEQARGDALDRRCDVFATGVLLYELLTGERYYEGLSLDDVWRRVGTGQHKGARLSALPVELRDIVQRAVAADPAARFPTCGELKTALHEYQLRRQQIGSAAELRALMAALFPDEEASDRLARAAMIATPMPEAPREVTRTVRFAMSTLGPSEESGAVTATHEQIAATPTESERSTLPDEQRPLVGARAATLVLLPRPRRSRAALTVGLAVAVIAVALSWGRFRASPSTASQAAPPLAAPAAPVEPAATAPPPQVVEPPLAAPTAGAAPDVPI
ncbi:MAG: hypothetical protein A2138_00135, partial [Deltaproteobacteria bacterium RBG_16_71_12]